MGVLVSGQVNGSILGIYVKHNQPVIKDKYVTIRKCVETFQMDDILSTFLTDYTWNELDYCVHQKQHMSFNLLTIIYVTLTIILTCHFSHKDLLVDRVVSLLKPGPVGHFNIVLTVIWHIVETVIHDLSHKKCYI